MVYWSHSSKDINPSLTRAMQTSLGVTFTAEGPDNRRRNVFSGCKDVGSSAGEIFATMVLYFDFELMKTFSRRGARDRGDVSRLTEAAEA